MKMKGQLDSAQPMKKHKAKSKKADLKKKKQAKLEAKKQSKEKDQVKAPLPTPVERIQKTQAEKKPITARTRTPTTTPSSVVNAEDSQTVRTRVSKSLEPMSKEEQLVAINQIIKRLLLDEITQGTALRELRVNVLGLRQEAYTELTGVSRKTLSEIENDKGNYTPEIINKVFKPFELKTSLVPTSSQLLIAILNS